MALLLRPVLGLAQGVALHQMLAPNMMIPLAGGSSVSAISILCLVLIPGAICLAIPALKPLRALAWAAVLTIIFAFLADYHFGLATGRRVSATSVAFLLVPVCFYALFIAQSLLLASVRAGRLRADYGVYFDVAWSQAVQIGLGVLFAALLWGVVALGAGLFSIIGMGEVWTAVQSRWFILPLLTTGFALSVNITDIRVVLSRTSRSLFLTLFAWLSVPLTLLTAAFLLTLPFTGLQPLWQTHRGGEYLVGAAFVHVLLINAVYGDATVDTASSRLLRWCASAACVLLTPLAAIAAYGALVRVGQHGLTPRRVFLIADIVAVGSYAVGYAVALVRSRTWLSGLQSTNVRTACVIVGLILQLWSPVADPVRIAVWNQAARLEDGRTPAAAFDFAFLQQAGRYGQTELENIQRSYNGPDAEKVRARARAAAAVSLADGGQPNGLSTGPATAADRMNQVIVYPFGEKLPADLAGQDWKDTDFRIPFCLRTRGRVCDAILLDVMNQGRPQVLFLSDLGFQPGILMAQDVARGGWHIVATAAGPVTCDDARTALHAGKFSLAQSRFPNIVAAARVIQLQSTEASACTDRR